MTQLQRLIAPGMADHRPSKTLNFEFDGKPYQGREGDTLAAALMANGVKIVGRSFKLHRPRGLMGSWVEESNGLVQLETGGFEEPNVRATMVMLYEGLKARGQNAWPNVQNDMLGLLDKFSPLLPASFYYKSMIWPTWHFYERFVRPIAGLGKAPKERDAQNYQKRNLHCDILICGGGPAGIAAALAAADSGLRVVLADDQEAFGGMLKGERSTIDGIPAQVWVKRSIDQLLSKPNVRLLSATNVSGYYENNFLVASQHLQVRGPIDAKTAKRIPRERLWRIHAQEVILAAGALERPLVCPNNDKPGVMLASAVRHYANRFGLIPGRKVVVVTNNDSAYRTALDLHDYGIDSITVVDTRAVVIENLSRQLKDRGIAHFVSQSVRNIKGSSHISAVQLATHSGNGQLGRDTQLLDCDLLAMSSGWTPTIHLYSQAGGSLRYDESRACLVPKSVGQHLHVAGSANGDMSLQECLDGGLTAAVAAVSACKPDLELAIQKLSASAEAVGDAIEPFWFTRSERTDKQWLDFQYDVKVSDIELAIRENFVSVEHVKRYTTGGMSVDQGKSSNFNILAIIAELTGKPIEKVGTTKFRPPYQPVTLGAFAGPTTGINYSPWQNLPAHAWHARHNAVFGDYGWQRPDFYPQGNEDIHAATLREVKAARNGVGMFDGSPLGKIQVSGPDAARFLDLFYVNTISTLKVGSARYAMLANENGVLIDDGVIIHLEENTFLVHATSGAVGRVALSMEEYLQCEWRELQVHINNVTTQWGNLTLSGPKARAVMEKLDCGIDLSPDAFPHMQYRQGQIGDVAIRVLRASFTGDVTFEIGVPARFTESLWEQVEEAGREFGITPYGVEALEVMRTEKGYLHVGSDTDACSNPLDLGMGRVIERKASDFIGRRSLQRQAEQAPDRLQFVGLESVDPTVRLPVGGHVVECSQPVTPIASHGYVTSAVFSPTLGKHIGLGIVRRGAQRLNEEVFVYSNGKIVAARIVPPAHFDSKGERLNG